MTLLRMDELNRLKESLVLKLQAVDRNRLKEISLEDDIFSLLEMAYMFGAEDVLFSDDKYIEEENKIAQIADLSLAEIVDYAVLEETINRPIENRTVWDRITEYTESGDVESLVRVIDTESHRVYNAGSFDTAVKVGKSGKKWVTKHDDRVRDTHDYLEGVVVPIDAEFYTFNGNHAMYPGQFGVPEEDINCRCIVAYV